MMENWVADSKRGPLRHVVAPLSAATLNQEKSEKRRQETPCSRLGDTREGIPHNGTHTARHPPEVRTLRDERLRETTQDVSWSRNARRASQEAKPWLAGREGATSRAGARRRRLRAALEVWRVHACVQP